MADPFASSGVNNFFWKENGTDLNSTNQIENNLSKPSEVL
jgi:hypothetical protein